MSKTKLTRNQKIAIGLGVALALGLGIFAFHRYRKNKLKKEECEKKGGKWDSKTKSCILPPPQVQEVVQKAYDNLGFESGKATILSSSYPSLNEIVDWLKENTNYKLDLIGHTDSQGNDEYNLDLSQRRANAVKMYIAEGGIASTRLSAVGKGEKEPIADNNTSEGRAKNRRVVFEITKI